MFKWVSELAQQGMAEFQLDDLSNWNSVHFFDCNFGDLFPKFLRADQIVLGSLSLEGSAAESTDQPRDIDAKVKMKYRPVAAWNNLDGHHRKKLLENGIVGNFFKGWRRKVGVAMLAMALILMVGWVRSFSKWDVIELNSWPRRVGIASSFNGDLLFYLASVNTRGILFWPSISLRPSFISKEAFLNSSDVVKIVWRWDWAGFHLTDRMHGDDSYQMCIVPYWCVVPPLTLLSAWLLLSKPRTSKLKQDGNATASSVGVESLS